MCTQIWNRITALTCKTGATQSSSPGNNLSCLPPSSRWATRRSRITARETERKFYVFSLHLYEREMPSGRLRDREKNMFIFLSTCTSLKYLLEGWETERKLYLFSLHSSEPEMSSGRLRDRFSCDEWSLAKSMKLQWPFPVTSRFFSEIHSIF